MNKLIKTILQSDTIRYFWLFLVLAYYAFLVYYAEYLVDIMGWWFVLLALPAGIGMSYLIGTDDTY